MKEHFLPVIWRSRRLLKSGKAAFHWENLGGLVTRDNGRTYRIFRQVMMDIPTDRPRLAGGVFCVWFTAKTSPATTIALSWKTINLFFGMRGFRSKTWVYDEVHNEFGGIYEWDTLEQAMAYRESFAMKLSSLRAVPGLFSTEVFPLEDEQTMRHAAYRMEKPA